MLRWVLRRVFIQRFTYQMGDTMTDQKQAPERIWYSGGLYHARHLRRVPPESDAHPQIEYAHHDLLEAAEKRIKELEDELKEVRLSREWWSERAKKAEAERDQALASVGAVIEKAMDAANEADSLELALHGSVRIVMRIHAINPDATAALNEMLAEAWDEGHDDACAGWRAGEPNPYRKPSRSSDAKKSEDRG